MSKAVYYALLAVIGASWLGLGVFAVLWQRNLSRISALAKRIGPGAPQNPEYIAALARMKTVNTWMMRYVWVFGVCTFGPMAAIWFVK